MATAMARIDLKNSVPDAMVTAGRMLSELGWKARPAMAEEVRLTRDLPWGKRRSAPTASRIHGGAEHGVTGLNGPSALMMAMHPSAAAWPQGTGFPVLSEF